jgi:hypothetical protein
MLPEETAIVMPQYIKGHSPEAQGNNLADEVAKETVLHSQAPMFHFTPVLQTPSLIPIFTPQEENQLEKLGASQTSKAKWLLPDGREALPKPIMTEVLTQDIKGVIGGPRLCVMTSSRFMCLGIYTLAKQVMEGCLICKKANKQP